jgi:hypothetical protein
VLLIALYSQTSLYRTSRGMSNYFDISNFLSLPLVTMWLGRDQTITSIRPEFRYRRIRYNEVRLYLLYSYSNAYGSRGFNGVILIFDCISCIIHSNTFAAMHYYAPRNQLFTGLFDTSNFFLFIHSTFQSGFCLLSSAQHRPTAPASH